MIPRCVLAGLLAGSVIATPLQAHEVAGSRGGRVADVGRYHAELVAAGEAVEVFLSEGDRALPAAGFKGTAILVVDGKPARVPLSPAGDRLAGRAPAILGPHPKGAVQITAPDGSTASGRLP
ncbi:hypothetical protein [Methylobacterium symbioticum]|uniref:Uncharacterized protein n=1 Tax=Methylobacterium symbioticum TaxID=2584084 RepID=A0A509EJH2_9HYPH|nr:hypothetical protein [Methylobacterium symbioticum]VUD74537.1 hypothetical protein MET9862_05169 [Methylobacterium symbioticum]